MHAQKHIRKQLSHLHRMAIKPDPKCDSQRSIAMMIVPSPSPSPPLQTHTSKRVENVRHHLLATKYSSMKENIITAIMFYAGRSEKKLRQNNTSSGSLEGAPGSVV